MQLCGNVHGELDPDETSEKKEFALNVVRDLHKTLMLKKRTRRASRSLWIKCVRGFDAKSRAARSHGSETRINVSARSACRTSPEESQRLLIPDDSVIIFAQTDPHRSAS